MAKNNNRRNYEEKVEEVSVEEVVKNGEELVTLAEEPVIEKKEEVKKKPVKDTVDEPSRLERKSKFKLITNKELLKAPKKSTRTRRIIK